MHGGIILKKSVNEKNTLHDFARLGRGTVSAVLTPGASAGITQVRDIGRLCKIPALPYSTSILIEEAGFQTQEGPALRQPVPGLSPLLPEL
jgi:hypothetical protein